jgi:hypothetical protein
MDTLFRSTIHTRNVKYALAMGNNKETMKIIKVSQNKCTRHVKSYRDIADDCSFTGVCEIRTNGFGPNHELNTSCLVTHTLEVPSTKANETTILYYNILYYTILYYTILYYTILYYTILYYTRFLKSNNGKK